MNAKFISTKKDLDLSPGPNSGGCLHTCDLGVKKPIPLVGENYKPGKCLLIYASAENLSWHNNKDNPLHQFFTGDNVWNR